MRSKEKVFSKAKFMLNPSILIKEYPYTVERWTKNIIYKYGSYDNFEYGIRANMDLNDFLPESDLDEFIEKYSKKYSEEYERGRLAFIAKTENPFDRCEEYLKFDHQRKLRKAQVKRKQIEAKKAAKRASAK